MAKLKSALARGASAAMGSLSQGMTALQQQRLEEARLQAQRQFQMELADKAHQRSLEVQGNQQDFQMELEGMKTQAQFAKELQAKRLGVATDANVPGVNPGQIAARATDAGLGDEFFPGTGSQINMPDDPRFSPEFRGKSLTHFAMPMREAGAERPPIEQLLQTAMQSQRGGLREDYQKRVEEFEKEEFIDPDTGVQSKRGPDGNVIAQERTAGQQGQRDASVYDAGTPGAVRRAGSEASARAHADPAILPILGPDGSTTSLARVKPTGAPDIFASAPLKAGGEAQDGTRAERARISSFHSQLEDFKALTREVNVHNGPEQLAEAGMRWFGGTFRMDRIGEEYMNRRDAIAPTLTAAISGAQANASEMRAFAKLIPGLTTTKAVAANLFGTLEKMFQEAREANLAASGLDIAQMSGEEIQAAAAAGQLVRGRSVSSVINNLNAASNNAMTSEAFLGGAQ